jgi:hypothetical protein
MPLAYQSVEDKTNPLSQVLQFVAHEGAGHG